MALLDIQNLRITTPDNHVLLNGVDLRIERGETVGILGPSGSGKSLTSWAIVGVIPKNTTVEGVIKYNNADQMPYHILSARKNVKSPIGRDISIIPQNPFTSLNPTLTCGRQIEESLRHSHMDKATMRQNTVQRLKELGFSDAKRIYKAWPFQLSGGQLQRVVIAMATVHNPQLLIADEPTSALDVVTQKQILKLLKNWGGQQEGRSLLFISHDVDHLREMCDRIYTMEAGRITGVLSADSLPHGMPASLKNVGPDRHQDAPIISVTSLTKTFRQQDGSVVKAVDNVDFKLYPNECLGLIGQTGCGKSTVARCLVKLEQPDSGEMYLNGSLIDYRKYPAQREAVQMIFQDPYSALYPHKTAGYFIAEPMIWHKMIRKKEAAGKVAELMNRVGLKMEIADKYPHQLSGGERQRVQIARAISLQPSALICDECVANLDAPLKAQILQLLKGLMGDLGLSMLFISHDLNVVRLIADRIMVMDNGRIMETGSRM